MSIPTRPPRRHRGKIVSLAVLGLLLLATSLTVRFLDHPGDVDAIDQDDETYYSQFFGVGLDTGSLTNLSCPSACPMSLVLNYDAADPGTLIGKFLGAVNGTQNGTDPAQLILVTPEGTGDFVLRDDSDPAFSMTTGTVTLPPGKITTTHGEKVTVTVLTIPKVSDDGYFGLTFSWHPGSALTNGGIGRRRLRLAYTTSHPALDEKGAYSLDIANPAESLKETDLELQVDGARISGATPDPDGRPEPRTASWQIARSQAEQYYVITLENATVRFWVDLVNEQTLFIAGLLLGAVIGAMTSEWFAGNRTPRSDHLGSG